VPETGRLGWVILFVPVAEPEHKPHGQTVSFVRDPFGNLVDISSPLE
jgi:hypothetical protein